MPYHRFGAGKFEALGLRYQLADLEQHREEQVVTRRLLESYGLDVTVG